LREGEAGDASLLPLSPGLGNVSQAEIERSMSVIGILFSHPADMSPVEDDEQDGSANQRNSTLVRKRVKMKVSDRTYTIPSTMGRVNVEEPTPVWHFPEPSPPGQLV
jgi:hypothetical protein